MLQWKLKTYDITYDRIEGLFESADVYDLLSQLLMFRLCYNYTEGDPFKDVQL